MIPLEVRDERGFAAAGGTDDTHELAFFDFEADVIQSHSLVRHAPVIDIGEVFHLHDCGHADTSSAFPVRLRALFFL